MDFTSIIFILFGSTFGLLLRIHIQNNLKINQGFNIQRFKGLGEMMPKQLWDTTMNPQSRMMKRVEIEDALQADRIFNILMGDKVAPRREFIETHSSNLDMATLDI